MSQQLADVVLALTSTKKKDRLISLEKLHDLLKQDNILKCLYSVNENCTLSWDVLFIRVHNAILMDLDRANSKNLNLLDKQLQFMQTTILNITQKSLYQEVPLLDCNTVLCCILSIFESDFRMKCLGSTYTELLVKYILHHRKFWGEIKLEYWIEIKNLCKNCFKNPPPNTSNMIYLDILSDVVRLSCKNVLIFKHLLDLFAFIKEIFTSHKGSFCAFEVSLLHLINILCLQLAVEFRYKVCFFMEDIFEFVISLYDKKKNSKNPLIYHFLITYLNVHNPNGAKETDESFYAYNERKWKQHVVTIFRLTQETTKLLLRYPENSELEMGFLDLNVDINHLIFINGFDYYENINLIDVSENYTDTPGQSKKRKRSIDSTQISPSPSLRQLPSWKNKQIKLDFNFSYMMQDMPSSETWFWLMFLELMFEKYPDILKTEFRHYAEFLSKLLFECRDPKIAQLVCRCLCIILSNEKLYKIQVTDSENLALNEMWNKIGIELIRLFQIEELPEYHMLMRSLIVNSKFSSPMSLINLYVKGIFQVNAESFYTLLVISQNCLLPESIAGLEKDNVEHHGFLRLFLLKWLFQGGIKCSNKEFSKILINLITTRSEEECDVPMTKNNETLIISKSINDFCKLITNNYEIVSLKNVKFIQDFKSCETSYSPKIHTKMISELFNCLDKRFSELKNKLLIDDLSFGQTSDIIRDSLHHCELLLYVCSPLMTFDIGFELWTDLLDKLKTQLYMTTNKSSHLLESNFFDLAPFISLYNSNFHKDLNKIIREKDSTCKTFIQQLFKLFQSRIRNNCDNYGKKEFSSKQHNNEDFKFHSAFSNLISNPRSVLHLNSLSDEEVQIIQIVEVLCQYILVPGCSERNNFQETLETKLFEELTNDNLLNYNIILNLQLVLRITYNFCKFEGLEPEALNKNIKLLLTVFESKRSDAEIAIVILQIMKDFVHLLHRIGNEESELNFLTLLNGFRTIILDKKHCGIDTLFKFIELMIEIVITDWGSSSIFDKSKNEYFKICGEVILFLKHSHYEVRLFTAQRIGVLFNFTTMPDETILEWQKKMMNLLYHTLKDNTQVIEENKNTLLVLPYYNAVGVSVALITWANIVCLSSQWRRLALFRIIELAYIKKINKCKICRIINLICEELKIKDKKQFIASYLPYLINKWVDIRYDIEVFPHYILECETMQEFLCNYSKTIFPIFVWNGCKNSATKICEKLNKSFRQVLLECFPELMAAILPCLSENVNSETVHFANKLKCFIENELAMDLNRLILKKLDIIIFNMFCHIEDKIYLSELCFFTLNPFDENNSMGFKVSQISEALETISEKEGVTLLGEIALERPSIIQKILILLAREVEQGCFLENKVISFYKYIAFVEILSKKTRQNVFGNIVVFIIRDVFYTLKAFIRICNTKVIIDMALKCLNKLIKHYIPEFSDVLSEFLPVITVMCTPLARDGYKEALDILKYLIIDNYDKLYVTIPMLDFFLNVKIFEDMNKIIKKYKDQLTNAKSVIDHFLEVVDKKRCSVEGLKCLKDELTNRKEDLKQMYHDLNISRGFSEDCKRSLLHRLIWALIELTADKNSSIRIEAAKCLGELGPSNLSTLLLKPENHYILGKQYETPMIRLLKLCIGDLSELIISENFDVKIAASELLYIILSTDYGNQIIKEEPLKMKKYLLPFIYEIEKKLTFKSNIALFEKNVDEDELWTPRDHEEWILALVTQILKSFTDSSGLFEAIIKLTRIYVRFAERIFPILMDLILSLKDNTLTGIINKNLASFFKEFFNNKNSSQSFLNLTSLHCMVNVIDYIRIQRNYEGVYEKFDLNVNYLHVAEAARCCSAFFTSILYVELWFHEKKKLDDNLSIDSIFELYPEESFVISDLLRDCYSKIGISDGVRGCGYMHLLDTTSEVQYYEHLNKWNLSMLHRDIQLTQGCSDSERHLLHSLEQSGMFYSLTNLIKNSINKGNYTEIQYKCASSLSDWNLFDSSYLCQNDHSRDSYEKCRYFALKAYHEDDQLSFENEIHKARKCTTNKLSCCSLESVQNLYQFLSELRCLKELEDFASAASKPDQLIILYQKWQQQDRIKCSDFKLVESILIQRLAIVKEELLKTKYYDLKNILNTMLSKIYYELIKTARKEKQYATAIRNLNYIDRLENIPDDILGKIKIEKSVLSWEIGEIEIGKFLLCQYLKRNDVNDRLKSKALRIYGDWMASTNSENARHIIEHYYFRSIAASKNEKDRMNSYASLAKFADSNYEKIREYLSSPLFEIKKNIINRQQDIASELRQEMGWNQDREKKIAYRLMERQSAIDENEIKNSENEKEFFLGLAIEYYLLSLKDGEKYDLLVFRLISLWFSNLDNQNVRSSLSEYLNKVPSYKFLCLLPQIVPRMSDVPLISVLVERSVKDHPYHTLPLLFALANSFEDAKYSGTKPLPPTHRTLTARAMLEKFQKDQNLKQHIIEMEQFYDAMIELANASPGEGKLLKAGTIIKIPPRLKVSRLSNLRFVAVPTLTIPCRKSCNYDGVTGIQCLEDKYQLVGGINVPKKIKCIGLDGVSRSLLVKGRDDLRQDAVMQQVFTIMNSLLYRNSETNRRKLIIRTYKVVPLSQRSGIIEWCENTQPLSLYLIGSDAKSGAHKKFNPNDITALECRSRIRQAFSIINVTNEFKLQVFLDICDKFRPAFRYFFIENFPEAGVWFERRLAYTRSVATSSMIGYVLGIGDRHVHNILVDNTTAEVIHIDLGIAFEQGKTLPTPETVPFRLTRDIVDGMGISGVEGVFRLSCIKTMEVLRENQHTILTLLEVLLYDPLYAWTVTTEKALSVQGHAGTESSSERNSSVMEINKMAERALIRLKQKLQGIEAGGVATNAEGQVNSLIQQARDPNNLCRLFHGWQAYL